MRELEGKGHCANSEGITDTVRGVSLSFSKVDQDIILLTFYCSGGEVQEGVEVMREAGSCEGTEKSEDGDEGRIRSTLYTILILKSHDYLLVFIWLSTFPYSSFLD